MWSKKGKGKWLGLLLVMAAVALLASAAPSALAMGGPGGGGKGPGGGGQGGALTVEEKYWLTYMREEEKLARDTYLVMYARWGAAIFQNISSSEQRHMDAVKNLLDKYGLPDPALGPGTFTNPHLQTLYDTLIAAGSVSLIEALKVGVTVEVTDIRDLDTSIASTSRTDIQNVYGNLLQGSYNHLDAFNSRLATYGITYSP